VTVAGAPPSFALSLVQGYYVEPLVAVALAQAGYVALPSAAILSRNGALVVVGHSGSGKSSVSVRALARGLRILGDDQVVIGTGGDCWPYPRRLRVYPDIQETAPEAWRRFAPSTRRALRLRRHVRRLTHGFAAPSLPVAQAELAPAAERVRSTARRLVVVVRDVDSSVTIERERDAEWAAERAAEVIAAQRSRFARAAGDSWRQSLAATARQEVAILRGWLASVPVTELRLPYAWDAPTTVGELAARLGVASPE
jgi:signal transduction histidine kinase